MDPYEQMLANGATPEQIEALLRTMLPRTRERISIGGAITNDVPPGQNRRMLPLTLNDRANLFTQMGLDTYAAEPDVTGLQQYARQRSEEGNRDMLRALAAQLAGERFAPVQAQFLKRAMAAQEPIKVGNAGYITPSGEYVKDTTDAQRREAEKYLGLGQLYSNQASREEQAAADRATRYDIASLRDQMRRNNAPNFQQGGPFALPDGSIVQGIFNPAAGNYVYNTEQGFVPIPAGARPATASMGGPPTFEQYTKKLDAIADERTALKKLDQYLGTVGDANVGIQRWADSFAAKARTAFGSKEVTPEQLAALTGPAQLQGLLGLFRESIVGPGVMTEYDAQRVLQALGGNFNQLQNPQFIRSLLADIRDSKVERINRLDEQLDYAKLFFKGVDNRDSEETTPDRRDTDITVDY